jgi:hypothetical protein
VLGVVIALLVIVVLVLVIEKLTTDSQGEGCFSKAAYFAAVVLFVVVILDSCSKKGPDSNASVSSSNQSVNTGSSHQSSNVFDPALVGSWENREKTFGLSLNPAGASWALNYIAKDLNVYSEMGSRWHTNGSFISLERDNGTVHVSGANGGEWNEPQPQGHYKFYYVALEYGHLRLTSVGAQPVELFKE